MNITASTLTSATATTAATTDSGVAAAAATTPVSDATDSPNEASGKSHGHRAHGGHGHLRQALNQALPALGLTGAQGRGDRDGDDDHGGAGNVKHDMAQFMHALFQAVKGESPSASGTTGASSADPKASFAAGLSALITQAGSGSAPKALQDAFDKLAADFHPAAAPTTAPATPDPVSTADTPTADPIAAPTSLPATTADANLAAAGTTTTDATSASSDASAAPAATTTTAPAATSSTLTLQALLSRLQQGMDHYGTRSTWATPSTGNAVNLTA